MSRSLIFPIIFLILSLLIGIGTWWITKNDFSYLVGFCTFITLSYIKIHFLIERNNQFYHRLTQFVKAINLNDNFDEISLLLNLKKIASFKKDDIHVDKDFVHEFWYECVSKVQNRFEALTFAELNETWSMGWNKIALGIQQDRIANNCKIARIFVLGKSESIQVYQDIFSEQFNIGIEVKWVYKDDLTKKKLIRNYLKLLRTTDFAIVDNRWTTRVILTSRRKIKKTIASKDRNILEKARKVFDEANHLANTYTP